MAILHGIVLYYISILLFRTQCIVNSVGLLLIVQISAELWMPGLIDWIEPPLGYLRIPSSKVEEVAGEVEEVTEVEGLVEGLDLSDATTMMR